MRTDVSVRIRLIDEASRGFARLEQQTRALQDNTRRLAQQSAQAARTEQDAHIRMYQAINNARQTLGVRGHAQIREEITRTQAAYRTLAQSGALSWREQAQAAQRMRDQVRGLTNEMGHLTSAQQRYGALRMSAGAVGAIAGGAAGAAYAMREPVNKALTFDQRIAYLANTAFPEADTRGRQLGGKELEARIHEAVRTGGGDAERVTTLLEEIVGGGVLSKKEAIQTLPQLTRTMTANNADPADVAALVNKLYGNAVVKNEGELARAMNMIVSAGQAGGFEFKDLAKYLPEQIGIGKSAGLTRLEGLQKILVLNEAAVMTAGTRDIAGRNVFNLLSKISSADTAKDFERMGRGDLGDYLMKERAKGVDAVTVWQTIIEQELSKDPKLKALKAQLASTTDKTEQRSLMEGISELAKGNVIVNYFQDMQAKNALLAYQNTDLVNRANTIIGKNNIPTGGANDRNFEPIYQTNAYKTQSLGQAVAEQQKKVLDKLTPTLGALADYANKLSKEHPVAAQALAATPWLGSALVGAGGGAMLMRRLLPAAAGAAEAGTGISAIARASAMVNSLTTRATALISRLPALASTAATYAAPYAPLAARVTAVGGAGYVGYKAGGILNEGLNAIFSKMMGNNATLGTAIYDLIHNNSTLGSAVRELMQWTPDPVEVNTQSQLTVTLAPGLVPTAQSSTSTSTAAKGKNKSIMFAGKSDHIPGVGNIWEGAP